MVIQGNQIWQLTLLDCTSLDLIRQLQQFCGFEVFSGIDIPAAI